MKRSFVYSVLVLLMSMTAINVFAYNIVLENADGVTIFYNYINDRIELEVVGCVCKDSGTDLVIPEEVTYQGRTRKVTSIGSYFENGEYLSSVTIPNSIKSIGNSAFLNSIKLSSLTLGNGVTSIGEKAFYGCSSLTDLTIPQSVTSIGSGAFGYCSNLSSVSVDNGNLYYDSRNNCNAVIETSSNTLIIGCINSVIPNSVTSIGDSSFSGCNGLNSLTIPNSITSIGEMAFSGCKNLTYISFPNSLITIGDNSFSGCKNLTYISFPNSLITIGDNSFAGCEGLTSITIPNSLKSIGFAAFANCKNLISIYIGENVTTIGSRAFANCFNLTSINIPSGVSSIGGETFKSCVCLSFITIPDNVVYIGEKSFADCESLTSIVIPDAVKTIDNYAFEGCIGLTSIVIPNCVNKVGDGAFLGCQRLATVTIGSGVTVLGEYAFGEDLTTIISLIEDPFEIAGIGADLSPFTSNTYYNATLYVPEGTIDKYKSTYGWLDFDYIIEGNYVPPTMYTLTYKVDNEVYKTYELPEGTVIIPEPAPTKEGYTFSGWSDIPSTMPAYDVTVTGSFTKDSGGGTSDDDWKFESEGITYNVNYDGTSVTVTAGNTKYQGNITIPSSVSYNGKIYDVTSIGDDAFNSCTGLTSILIPNSVKVIGFQAFLDCVNLTSLTIPDGVTTIETNAFGGCSGLNSVTIPNSVSRIGNAGFIDCSSLTNIIIPNSMTTISHSSFFGCSSLSSIIIPNNITNIEDFAFGMCDNLIDVYCYAEYVPKTGDLAVFTSVKNTTLHVPSGSVSVYKTTAPWRQFKEIVAIEEEETDEEQIIISGAKQIPYCSKFNLDFTDLPDLKAYVATGYDKAKGTIWLTRVKQVPAETGFLLIGDPGDYDIPTIDGISDVYYKNMFKGTLTGTTIYTTDGDYTNYYLSSGASGVGFYKVTNENGVSIKPNRCYLPILTDIPANGSEGDAEVIKVSAAKQVPYYTSKNIDFTSLDVQGVKAYTATGYNYGSGVIWLTRVKKVPAQTGILVIADEAGDYSVPTTSVQSVYENMFTGSETAQTIYTTETVGDIEYINYYLSNGASGIGFYKVTNVDGVSMGANRSYLQIPKRDSAAGARGMDGDASFSKMMISNDDDDVIAIPVFGEGTTGISTLYQNAEQNVYYNLQGQRVDNPNKGLYIKNGKKVIIR